MYASDLMPYADLNLLQTMLYPCRRFHSALDLAIVIWWLKCGCFLHSVWCAGEHHAVSQSRVLISFSTGSMGRGS